GGGLGVARRAALLARLEPGASIGMDGVLEMEPFYARGGFAPAGVDVRHEGVGAPASVSSAIVDARDVSLDALVAYDAAHFPARRAPFLERWIAQPGARALVSVDGGDLQGFGLARPCRLGGKIGPLFAAD